MARRNLTQQDHELINQIASYVREQTDFFVQAGEWLDSEFSPEACLERDLATYPSTYPFDLPTVNEWRPANKRLAKAVQWLLNEISDNPGELLECALAARILLVNWIMTDPGTNQLGRVLTSLQDCAVGSLSHKRSRELLISEVITDWANWMDVCRRAWVRRPTESNLCSEIESVSDSEVLVEPKSTSREYIPPSTLDIFAPGNEWLGFGLYMDMYKMHVSSARMQRQRFAVTLSNVLSTEHLAFEKQFTHAVEPFTRCLDEHLKRVVREHPQQLQNVTEIRADIFKDGSPRAAAAADLAFSKAIELIKAVHNGHPPEGRSVPIRSDAGNIIATRWQWAENIQATLVKAATEPNNLPHDDGPRCLPMSKEEMARRICGDLKARARKVKSLLLQWKIEPFGKLWTVRLDLMPAHVRKRFEEKPHSH